MASSGSNVTYLCGEAKEDPVCVRVMYWGWASGGWVGVFREETDNKSLFCSLSCNVVHKRLDDILCL